MSALPKPVLRGHLRRNGIKMLGGAVTFSLFCASLYKFLVAIPRENAYQEFLRTYDLDKHYEELVKYGYLQSVKAVSEK